MRHLLIATAIIGTTLAGCAAVPKQAALNLAAAGDGATGAMRSSLIGLSDDVAGMPERRAVKMTLDKCRATLATPNPGGGPPTCDPVRIPAANTTASLKLQQALTQRANAYAALGKAYEALAAEADYDARGDVETALGQLFDSTNALGATLGLEALPQVQIAERVGTRLAGLGAEQAQRRRLVEASAQIRRAVEALRKANTVEAGLYGEIATAMADSHAAVEDSLLRDGFIDPRPSVQAFVTGLGYGLAPTIGASDPRLVATARTLSASRADASARAAAAVYTKTDAVFAALIRKHEAFEHDRPGPSLDRALEDLHFWNGVLIDLRSSHPPEKAKTP